MKQFEIFVDAVRAQLEAADLCAGNVIKSPNRPTKDDDLPQARVFVSGDDARAYGGSARIGERRYTHTTSLVVEVLDKAAAGEDLKSRLCLQAQAVLDVLLGDESWHGDVVEGIGGVRQVYDQPIEGNLVLGRVQLQLDVLWTSDWPARLVAVDDFTSVSVDAGRGLGSTIDVPQ